MTPKDMIAYRFQPSTTEPVVETLPIPTPSPDEILVKVLAAGVCHSDLSILTAGLALPEWTYNFTLGHEGAGTIISLGSNVPESHPGLDVGTYVAFLGSNPCETLACVSCSHGLNNTCRSKSSYGLGIDGSRASYMTVRATCAVPVPGDVHTIPPGLVAAATDAALTPYHALKSLNLRPEHTILIIGAGGLGHIAIQIAKNCYGVGRVVAIDIRETSLEVAVRSGADFVTKPDGLETLLAEKRLVVDIIIDFVGNQQTLLTSMGLIRPGGVIQIIGLGTKNLDVPLLTLSTKDLTIRSSFWGTKLELEEVLGHIADGKITPEVKYRPMNEVAKILKEMAEGTLEGRIALLPIESNPTSET